MIGRKVTVTWTYCKRGILHLRKCSFNEFAG
jgi:hypothetical protein